MEVRWDHASLAVIDITVAMEFFRHVFGFEVAFVERGMSDQIASMLGMKDVTCDLVQLTRGDGPRLELIAFSPGADDPVPLRPLSPGMAHVSFRARAFEETIARAVEHGATPVGDVTEFKEGRSIYLATPFGAFLEIEEARDTS